MTTFRIYNVVDPSGRVIKIGSTIQPLSQRSKQHPYNTSAYKNCPLFLRREFEHEDRDFGLILLRIREQFEISRARTWWNQGGWNVAEPVQPLLNGFDNFESAQCAGRIGGAITGPKAVASGQLASIRNLPQTKIAQSKVGNRNVETGQIHKIRTAESTSLGGKIQGRRNKESGQVAAMGRKHGPTQGRKNKEAGLGIFSLTHEQRVEISRKFGHLGGKIGGPISGRKNVESGQINALGREYGPVHGRKNVENGHLTRICVAGGQATSSIPGQMAKMGRIGGRKNVESGQIKTLQHIRWHVKRGISNPKCLFCTTAAV